MSTLPRFDRQFFDGSEEITVIGSGSLGGKARGLVRIREVLAHRLDPASYPEVSLSIPVFTVIATDVFDEFMAQNDLYEFLSTEESDRRIAMAFQRASLPPALVGDLQALMVQVHRPLAVRSSSLLEDALEHPFAGVYATKMIPNNQHDTETRFRRLVEAIKFVYASTFFRDAREYLRATRQSAGEEKMAVILQEVVGRRHRDRFYPDISGVGRSYNFYPTGHGAALDGVVTLALGLGRAIVDDGMGWSYSPAYPRANPPYNSFRDLLQQTQAQFWAVNMGKPPEYDPINEVEYLLQAGLDEAEEDEVLGSLASVYDKDSDCLVMDLSRRGPRVLTFAPLLVGERLPLNAAVSALLAACREELGADVEIEFAVTLEQADGLKGRVGCLQVRPMAVSDESVELAPESFDDPRVLAASTTALGNGVLDTIRDVVYLRPESFDTRHTAVMASELGAINRKLVADDLTYLLLGFGRWGTSDPWLGVPVAWSQISGARAIIESTLPGVEPEPSQGSHFFHNVTSFHVLYLTIRHSDAHRIRWEWLDRQEAVNESRFLRHVRLKAPLQVVVDGRSGRGAVFCAPGEE